MSSLLAPILLALMCPTEDPVRVTVVTILATSEDTTVDPKLVELAKAVQQRDKTLTGFRLVATEAKSIPVGSSHTFELADKQVLRVVVTRSKDTNNRISLTIKPPGLEKVTYGCTCDKFFPVVTPHRTKKGELLIVAVMAKPCTAGKHGWFPWGN